MTEKTDQTYRQWLLLRSIPRAPNRRSTRELYECLRAEGYEITLRSVQRDLLALSTQFGFVDEVEGRTSYWFWPRDFRVLDVPGMEPETALVFFMAQRHLGEAVPPSVLRQLEPYFRQAEHVLEQTGGQLLGNGSSRVRLLPKGPGLQRPDTRPEVLTALEEGVVFQRTLRMHYQRRGEQHIQVHKIDPRGLVLKDGVTYLVGTYGSQLPPYHFAAHRIQAAETTGQSSPPLPDFDLDRYLHSVRAFDYPYQDQCIALQLLVAKGLREHLEERPLSAEQRFEDIAPDGSALVHVSVPDTSELRWWLLAHGEAVKVVAPADLRDEVAATLSAAASQYGEKT
ncbi:MAG: helix-turn-helix transcriptional regulator [Algiphilus sp.]